MSVDLRKIKKLIELVEESGISELEVSDGDESIRISRALPSTANAVATLAPATLAPDTLAPAVVVPASGASRDARGSDGFDLRSPMPGTFYRAAAPDAEPFVVVGQAVEADDVVCIIESMKMMNEVRAEKAGVCVAAPVENAAAIGSGQVLFRFE